MRPIEGKEECNQFVLSDPVKFPVTGLLELLARIMSIRC